MSFVNYGNGTELVEDCYGKVYDADENLKYEGIIKNRKYNSWGKLYDPNGKLVYEGEWKHGRIEGFGKTFDNNGNISVEGIWLPGLSKNDKLKSEINGISRFYRNGKLFFEGICKMGNPVIGRAYKLETGNLLWEGTYNEKGVPYGYGKLFKEDGTFREGFLENGKLRD